MPHDAPVPLPQLLKTIRGPMTQAEFARRIEMSESLIARAETGARSISEETAYRIIERLELDDESASALLDSRRAFTADNRRPSVNPDAISDKLDAIAERLNRLGDLPTKADLDRLMAKLLTTVLGVDAAAGTPSPTAEADRPQPKPKAPSRAKR